MSTPRRPSAHLRIGITGHRLGKLPADSISSLTKELERIIAEVAVSAKRAAGANQDFLVTTSPKLIGLSSLASGADQIFAVAALQAGWLLDCILPFPRAQYASDFASDPTSLATFNTCIGNARSVFELDPSQAGSATPPTTTDTFQRSRAYEAAGLLMLANVDLLVAVWDDKPAEGLGGTALIVNSAVEEGIPVILIDPTARAPSKVIWRGFTALPPSRARLEEMERRAARDELPNIITALIAAPAMKEERDRLSAYLAEEQTKWVGSLSFPLLLGMLCGNPVKLNQFLHPEFVDRTRQDWVRYLRCAAASGRLAETIAQTLLPAYAFADRLAVAYAQRARSAFTYNYFAAFLAVLLALLGVFALFQGDAKRPVLFLELVLITTIAWGTGRAQMKRWHERWLDYRRLAEELRILRVQSLLGAGARFNRPSLQAINGHGWINWLIMMHARELPLPTTAASREYLLGVSEAIRTVEIGDQIKYNRNTAALLGSVESKLHHLGQACFAVTFIVGLFYLLVKFQLLQVSGDEHALTPYVTFLTALLPMLGATLNAIRAQGDFGTISKRSMRTVSALEEIGSAMLEEESADSPQLLSLARLSDRLEKAADAMASDLDQWQILSTTKPVSLPA